MKLYTRTGDKGTTSLVGGSRVDKDDVRIEAYGTLDELTAHLGYLHDLTTSEHRAELITVLEELMVCQALLAAESQTISKLPKLKKEQIERLERWTDALMQDVPVLRHFTLPAGNVELSYSHICRTVCRRAERRIVTAAKLHSDIPFNVATYVNRLSDYLYAFGRNIAHVQQVKEFEWIP